jgi:hypothetical protein
VPAHVHDFGPWVIYTAPQPGVSGWEGRTCKIDGFTEGRAIPALPELSADVPPPQPGAGTPDNPGRIPSPEL